MLDPTEVIDLTQDSPVPIRPRRIRHRQTSNQQHNEYNAARDRELDEIARLIDEYDFEHENAIRTRSTDVQGAKDMFKTKNALSLSDQQQSPNVATRKHSLDSPQMTLECPICLDSLFCRKQPMTTICGHIFCYPCLKLLFNEASQTKCPKCNRRITWKSCIQLYF